MSIPTNSNPMAINKDRPFFMLKQNAFTEGSALSPVTHLAFNLGGLTTSSLTETPRRRISWSSSDGSCSSNNSPLRTWNFDLNKKFNEDTPVNRERRCLLPKSKRMHPVVKTALFLDKENIPTEDTLISAPSPKKKIENWTVGISEPQIDNDSQDSGFSEGQPEKENRNGKSKFHFIEPTGKAPRRSKSSVQSPSASPAKILSSTSSTDSGFSGSQQYDDGFLEVFDMDKLEEESDMPSSMKGLLTAPLAKLKIEQQNLQITDSITKKKLPIRRCLSMVDNDQNREVSSTFFRTKLLSTRTDRNNNSSNNENCYDQRRLLKRSDPSKDPCTHQTKRHKSVSITCKTVETESEKKFLQRSFSENEATIKLALQRSVKEPNLIGDYSKAYILPVINSCHEDLKSITSDTMAAVLKGEYKDSIDSCTIIDCRYPYEYEGGHIQSAKNIYNKEGIQKEFLTNLTKPDVCSRHIIIFHCEFSSERGPALSRFLRNKDREINDFPKLHHPELYLLHGGYKAFYQSYKELCIPQQYKPMLHKDHEEELRHFRTKSKSWSGESKRYIIRSGLKF